MKYLFFLFIFLPYFVSANGLELYDYEKSIYNNYLDAHTREWIQGVSMVHLGIKDGVYSDIYWNKPCSIGDICAFSCISDKCEHEGLCKQLKRTKYIKGDGMYYWFEGRPDEYLCPDGDGMCHSFDSLHDYGWLKAGRDFYGLGFIPNPL